MNIIRTVLSIIIIILWGNSYAIETKNSIERFNKTVHINKSTKVKIVNHYGDIRIRKADDDVFIYHGVAQNSKEQKIILEYQQSMDEITAIVKLSNPEGPTKFERFDLVLIVPELVALDIEIEGGNLSTKGIESAIKVRSDQSNITVKTSKAVDLLTKTGSIDLFINSTKFKIQNKLQTHKGPISVNFDKKMPYFEAITGHYVTSNSALLLKSLKKQRRTAIYGNHKNNRHIYIKTDTGQISLIDLAQ